MNYFNFSFTETIRYFQENSEFLIYCFLGFFVSFIFGSSQFLVGSIVNCLLVLGAFSFSEKKKLLPLIVFPSLGVLSSGLIFGSLSIFLLYLIPFIWIGNWILVYFSGKFFTKGVFLGVLLKAGFLFSVSFVFYSLGLLPTVFLVSMGIIQIYTGFLGGFLGICLNKIRRNFF